MAAGPARRLAQPAVRSETQFFRGGEGEAPAHASGHIVWLFDEVTFHIDDADTDVFSLFGDVADDFDFRKLTAGHFEVHFVDGEVVEGRVERRVLAWGHGARFAYLQVVATNEAALPLYADQGFRTAYGYEYLLPPSPAA